MDIIVCKFGGSSLADGPGFERVWDIVRSDARRAYVVLSAPGTLDGAPKVTDLLDAAWDGDGDALQRVIDRFEGIAASLGLPGDYYATELTRASHISRACLMSRGEYLSARLFADHAGLPFIDAADFIRFDGAGRLSVPRTLDRLRLLPGRVPRAVLPGFYGAGPDGQIVTLPRNGSDITGALVAAGVGASLYENWTDVPGLMTCDPATCPEAKPIPEIAYRDMRALARGGARVLHPDCLAPVEDAGIPTRVTCTMDPEAEGTLIH